MDVFSQGGVGKKILLKFRARTWIFNGNIQENLRGVEHPIEIKAAPKIPQNILT